MATQIAMPSLGMVMTEGTIARWLVPDGGSVEKGQPLVEIETDKLTHQIEAPAAGLVKHAAAEGQVLPVEGLIAWVLAPGESPPSIPTATASRSAGETTSARAGESTHAGAGEPAGARPSSPAHARDGEPSSPRNGDGPIANGPGETLAGSPAHRIAGSATAPLSLGWGSPPAPLGPRPAQLDAPRPAAPVSPAARRLAVELGVDLSRLRGSGPGGRVVEADVRAASAAPATRAQPATAGTPAPTAQPSTAGAPPSAQPAAVGAPVPTNQPATAGTRAVISRTPFTGMRRAIADRMTRSLASGAQLTLTREVDASALVAARRARRSSLDADLPYDAFFVRALARALTDDPALNAVVEGDEILVLGDVHVGVAVAVPGGLLVPVVRDAATRPLAAIGRDLVNLAERARAGRLSPDDLAGGTVTITNLGAQGVDVFTPILNPPQSAILGIGRIVPRPLVIGDALAVRPTVHLSLTFDHRVADGVPAAELLGRVARLISDQGWLMAEAT